MSEGLDTFIRPRDEGKPLTEEELKLVQRVFSDPFAIPLEWKAWLRAWLESDPPLLTTASIFGFASAAAEAADAITSHRVLLRKTAAHTYGNAGGAPGGYLAWDTEVYDPNGMHDPADNTKIIIQQDGVYLFLINLKWATNVVGNRGVVLDKNGGVLQTNRAAANPTGGEVSAVTLVCFEQCVAGNYFQCYGYQTSGANLNVITSDGGLGGASEFSAMRLSA